MTASTEPRGGLEYGWDPGEDGWGPSMNANLLRLSRVGFHPSVVSKSTTAPPGSPVSGEGHIVPSGATGAWSGQSGKIAIWDGAAWAYITPRDGFLVHVADADGLALYDGGAWSADVLRADRLATAYAHSQATGNPHSTTAAQVGALQSVTLTGAIDSHSINGGASGLYDLRGSSYVNFPAGFSVGGGGMLLQTIANTGRVMQELNSEITGKMLQYQTGPSSWSGWKAIWDEQILPVTTVGRNVVAAATQAAARSAIGAAAASGISILLHSDFGRSAETDVWQSAFTNNTASGLQLADHQIFSGTHILVEQDVVIPADASGATYQFYIGPQLTGEQAPSGSTYAIVLDPNSAGGYGQGRVRIECELISASVDTLTGYVTSTFSNNSAYPPQVKFGTITVDKSITNSIDIRFNPQSVTGYIIRRNRVYRTNP